MEEIDREKEIKRLKEIILMQYNLLGLGIKIPELSDGMVGLELKFKDLGTSREELSQNMAKAYKNACKSRLKLMQEEASKGSYTMLSNLEASLGELFSSLVIGGLSLEDIESSTDDITKIVKTAYKQGAIFQFNKSKENYSGDISTVINLQEALFYLVKGNLSFEDIGTTEEEFYGLIRKHYELGKKHHQERKLAEQKNVK